MLSVDGECLFGASRRVFEDNLREQDVLLSSHHRAALVGVGVRIHTGHTELGHDGGLDEVDFTPAEILIQEDTR